MVRTSNWAVGLAVIGFQVSEGSKADDRKLRRKSNVHENESKVAVSKLLDRSGRA